MNIESNIDILLAPHNEDNGEPSQDTAGVLASHAVGRTRPYVFNPLYPFLNELKSLLQTALSFYPTGEQEQLVVNRCRPRSRAKEH